MKPLISVIIPVRDQLPRLQLTLVALEAQAEVSPAMIEVIVIDDGSSDGAAEAVRGWACTTPYRLSVLPSSSGGCRGVPRNLGAQAATSDVLLFLDADACPSRDLIRHHLAAQRSGARVALGDCWVIPGTESLLDPSTGTRFPRLAGAPDPAAIVIHPEELRRRGDEVLAPHAIKGIYPGLEGWQLRVEDMLRTPGCLLSWLGVIPHNLSLGRDALIQLGGFDPFMRHAEGADLGVRARHAGFELAFVEGARSYHLYHHRDPTGQQAAVAEAQALLCRRYPSDGIEAAFLWMLSLDGDRYIPAELDLCNWRVVDRLQRDPASRAALKSLYRRHQRLRHPGSLLDYLDGGAINTGL